MEGLDVDDIFHHYRLSPTEVDAVTYYLPRLLSGETLHAVDKLIHRVEISGCEPKDLAARYAPVPQAVSSGDRFFFTTCKSKNGSKLQSVRGAGGGTWTIQKTTEICHAGVKVGEVKNLSFKKKGKSTGWVMEEYRCLLPEATVSDGVKVFCKMHLAQHAPDAARQESEAYKLQQQQPEAVTPSTHAQKRPAPAAAADPHPSRPKKRMRGAVPVPAPATPSFTAAAPDFLPDESVPEADDDMDRFCCTIDELLGLQVEEDLPVGATNSIEQNFYLEPEGPQKLFADAAEEIVPLEADELEFLRAILDEGAEEQEREAVSTNDKSSIVQDVGTYNPPPIIFHDPFEEAWKAEEALENERRCNAAANLHAGGHSNFFSPASVY
ncbi:NAC domain-containing protein 79-like [Triticum urartu]|uniref:NAC domain-containing protein 79-like n=1 Tax=Triticum urartu TaxID=4572 RepID=UPI0020435512|nr:NAC domain-containing protein 79-like [Triticum urartu]